MRRLFLLVLVTLLVAVWLVAKIEADPGYILIAYGLTTIETSLWVGLLLLLVFNVLFYFLLRFLHRLWATRGAFSNWLSLRAYSRELVQLEIHLGAEEYAAVVSALEPRLSGKPTAQELRLLGKAYSGQQNWLAVIDLLPRLRKRRAFAGRELADLEYQAYLGILNAAPASELKKPGQACPRSNANVNPCSNAMGVCYWKVAMTWRRKRYWPRRSSGSGMVDWWPSTGVFADAIRPGA